jgi:predicted nucleotidyltransferase
MGQWALPLSLRRVVGRYVRAFAPERIVLFGSYAKGTNRPGSDLDVLIVADLEGDISAHMRRAHQLAADCFPPVDVVFATTEDVERSTADRNPFLLSILGTGIALYSRGQAATMFLFEASSAGIPS